MEDSYEDNNTEEHASGPHESGPEEAAAPAEKKPSALLDKLCALAPFGLIGLALLTVCMTLRAAHSDPYVGVEHFLAAQNALLQETYERWRRAGGDHALPASEADRHLLAYNLLGKLTSASEDDGAVGTGRAQVFAEPTPDSLYSASSVRLHLNPVKVELTPEGVLLDRRLLLEIRLERSGHAHWQLRTTLPPLIAHDHLHPVFRP